MVKRLFQNITSFLFRDKKFIPAKLHKPENKGRPKYNPQRSRNLYSDKPFKLSRSKLDLFLECQRCFYLDRKLGTGRPAGYPFNLNNAVDSLLKKEFDAYRLLQKPHPICRENNLNTVVPFSHENIDQWRKSLHAGIQYKVPNTNLTISGGLDDVWIDLNTKKLIVVDYKATSKNGEVSLDADWQISYKRQAEIYQWLLRKNNFNVSNTAYFVYCNGKTDLDRFDKKLNFNISLLPYVGDDSWVDETIMNAYKCLQSNTIPSSSETCEYCQYCNAVDGHLNKPLINLE